MNSVDTQLMSRYDQEADSYDAKRYLTYYGEFLNELETCVVVGWVLGGSGSWGLDIPCGTGQLTSSLAHCCEKVAAGDISITMLDIARKKAHSGSVANITFLQVNGRRLSFSENTFDTIICFNFLHLIPNDQKCEFMAEFARVLKPGGKLIVGLKSPFHGLFLSLLKYHRRLGEIPRRFFSPGQGRRLFHGYRKGRVVGVGFPLFSGLARIFGKDVMMKISLALGGIPGFRFLAYGIIFELHNDKQNQRRLLAD